MRTVLILVGMVASLTLAACGDDGDAASDGKLQVVATTQQLGDMARQTGGDAVSVETILDAKVDPHEYEPRPSDAEAIAGADLVLRSGGEVDEWMDDLVEQAGGDAEQITLAEEIDATGDDPHWWQDPRNAIKAVDALARAFGDGKAPGARAYKAEISEVDRTIERCMSNIPVEGRKLVTNHDAFGYFARRYDIEILGSIIPGRSTAAQPSAGDVRRLVEAIKREGVTTIFPESALGTRLEDAVARQSGAEVGPALYADTVGPDGSYLEALMHDATVMAEGFGAHCSR